MRFDQDIMDDFKYTAVDDGPWVVAAVVTGGLVRKQHRDATEGQRLLVKARVILERGEYLSV